MEQAIGGGNHASSLQNRSQSSRRSRSAESAPSTRIRSDYSSDCLRRATMLDAVKPEHRQTQVSRLFVPCRRQATQLTQGLSTLASLNLLSVHPLQLAAPRLLGSVARRNRHYSRPSKYNTSRGSHLRLIRHLLLASP